jgi:hypothetical protein
MTDDKNKYGNLSKVVQFRDTDKKHADLRIRLHYDGFQQGEFFREVVAAYIDGDENIAKFVQDLKISKKKQSKAKRNKSASLAKSARENKKLFSLNDNELESIFDIIEKEYPDL